LRPQAGHEGGKGKSLAGLRSGDGPLSVRAGPSSIKIGCRHRHRTNGLVSFLVSFMYVCLSPSPSTTAHRAGSMDPHGRSCTVIRNTEKRKVEVLRAPPFYAGAVPLSAFPAQ
jgi:hypothetical protein